MDGTKMRQLMGKKAVQKRQNKGYLRQGIIITLGV